MTVEECEVSVIIPYDFEWIQQYLNEGWIERECVINDGY